METRVSRVLGGFAALLFVAAVAAASAPARSAAPPQYTSIPTIEGPAEVPFVGDTLRATTGTWTGSPTRFSYQWDRCNAIGDRQGCGPISGATSAAYKVQKADVGHTLRVRVTATNKDGSATKDSKGTGIVSDTAAPKSYSAPSISGNAALGATLTASAGTWAGATSIGYRWQQCDASGGSCADISEATGKTYSVRTGDVGNTLRVRVTATNKYGSTTAVSKQTAVVTGRATTTTTTGGNSCAASGLKLPTRLLIDRWTFSPGFVTALTRSFTARIHVSATPSGCDVSGAQLWATAIPYNQTNVVQTTTLPNGWATLTFAMQGGFPANPGRQQILAILVRATQPGGSSLAGVSTRRVIGQRVRLR